MSLIVLRVFVLLVVPLAYTGGAVRASTGVHIRPAAAKAGSLRAVPTFHAAGICMAVEGDVNRNARALVQFRKSENTKWREALPLARIDEARFAGSLFYLEPDTVYEVRITLQDPDGTDEQPARITFRTLAERFPTGTGRTWYVAAGGEGDGSRERPFGVIQKAIDKASPGDTVLVRKGTYREAVSIQGKAGTRDAYILIQGEAGTVISGALEELEQVGSGRWREQGGDLFSTEIPEQVDDVGYVAAGEERLYRYWSLQDLRRRAAGVEGGWYWERPRLYAALPNGGNPDQVSMRVAVRPFGFRIENSSHLIVEGFDLGFFGTTHRRARGSGILLENSSDVVIRRNRIHHCNRGVRTEGVGAIRILIEENELYDTSVSDWPWDGVKGTEAEGAAVSLRGGPAQVVRRNRISGYFNGVTASTWGDLENESLNVDLDIYENEFSRIGDDPVEPEGVCINVRIWANTMEHSLSAVSVAPIMIGPTYVLRNTSYQHFGMSLKMPVAFDNLGIKYIFHNTFVSTLQTHRGLDGSPVSQGVIGARIWPSRPWRVRPELKTCWANAVFYNNIFYGSAGALEGAHLCGKATFDYNNLYSMNPESFVYLGERHYPDLEAFRKAGYERNGLNAKSRFQALREGNLCLEPGSPEIDRGLRLPNINDDFSGEGPDIGACEVQE